MRPVRPLNLIRHELDTALAYRARYAGRPPADQFASQLRDDNEREIAELEAELRDARRRPSVGHVLSTAKVMADELSDAGIQTREAAKALTIDERDAILGVAAWSGYEDASWQCALIALDPGSQVAP